MELEKLIGQWFGTITGANSGWVILNIENLDSAQLLFTDDFYNYPGMVCNVKFENHNNHVIGKCSDIKIYNQQKLYLDYWDNSKNDFEGIQFNNEINFTIHTFNSHSHIKGDWRSGLSAQNISRFGQVELFKHDYKIEQPTTQLQSWSDFKSFLESSVGENKKNFIYRGQKKPYSLETSYHRIGNSRLDVYTKNILPIIKKRITASSNEKYNLEDEEDFLTLMNLSQHHGFPTPFLDWTESPYIALYFAFERITKKELYEEKFTRLIFFNKEKWLSNGNYYSHLLGLNKFSKIIKNPYPMLLPISLPIRNNLRALNQQSIMTFSNIRNIELLIWRMNPDCIRRVDLPYSIRNEIMENLREMGITAHSLFPGYDGLFSTLKEDIYNFNRY